MKSRKIILAGWLTFVFGHAAIVAVRARMLATVLNSGTSRSISETTFRTADGVVLAAAILMIAAGTFSMLHKPRWKLALALLALVVQIAAAYLVYMILTFTVHVGVGGPL